MRALLTATAFLTRIPVRAPADPSLARAAVWFPLVGLIVGGLAAGTRALADLALPPLPATLLAVTVAVLVTGALHEDGLADVADGIGAHTTRERRLEILRDPRVGTFGALALILCVLLVTTSVAALDTTEAVQAFAVAHVLARWAVLPVARFTRPARPDGAGSLLAVSTPTLVVATAGSLAVAVAIAGVVAGLSAVVAAAVVAALTSILLTRTLGGVTGDGYGAAAKLTETAVCITLMAQWA